ncbi:MAG: hypothetical protein LW855_01690 [Alphaproteobacteria bacterium]|jgi:hypothetical protein|nr:hypothetical protein [Thalassospira sp.]MCE2964490.1 hypothetical protein [Alphaproteobacteria bacterium]
MEISFTQSPDLLAVAARTVWFKPPAESLRQPLHFIAHVLTYGLHEDVVILRQHVDDASLRYALEKAPPGIFDPRSWAYWHLMTGLYPPPPLPTRHLPG